MEQSKEVDQTSAAQWDSAVAAYARLMERCGDLMALVVPASPATLADKKSATKQARDAFEHFLDATAKLKTREE